jgi:hypothetical protein
MEKLKRYKASYHEWPYKTRECCLSEDVAALEKQYKNLSGSVDAMLADEQYYRDRSAALEKRVAELEGGAKTGMKIGPLKNCESCGNLRSKWYRTLPDSYWCHLTGNTIDYLVDIPDWCPLPEPPRR